MTREQWQAIMNRDRSADGTFFLFSEAVQNSMQAILYPQKMQAEECHHFSNTGGSAVNGIPDMRPLQA